MYVHCWIMSVSILNVSESRWRYNNAGLSTLKLFKRLKSNSLSSFINLMIYVMKWNVEGFFYYLNSNTISIVVLKQDVDTVDVVHSTKIHLPPHGLVRTVSTHLPCPHTCRCNSVYGVTCVVNKSKGCLGLRGVLIVWQVIFKSKSS